MRTILTITGMHCRSCELLLEQELLKLPGVTSVAAQYRKGTVTIDAVSEVSTTDVRRAVRRSGYDVGDRHAPPFITHNPEEYGQLIFGGLIVAMLAILWQSLGLSSLGTGEAKGIGTSILLGLTAGVSTCIALVGGLVLGVSARFAERHPEATMWERLRPHAWFHAGRIIGFSILGGILGTVGILLVPSSSVLGILTVFVGLVMLILGIQVTEISPMLSHWRMTLPSSLARIIGIHRQHERKYSHVQAAWLGILTFFLPCGFTQLVQMNAVVSGGFFQGAFMMGGFALGTVPGLLGIGGLASSLRGVAGQFFRKAAGVAVTLFAIVTILGGINLMGISLPTTTMPTTFAPLEEQEQVVRMEQWAYGYRPNNFTIRSGVPVRWIITSSESRSCATSLRVPTLGISRMLQPGENIITFTPTQHGTIIFTCSMGMYTGRFTVIAE